MSWQWEDSEQFGPADLVTFPGTYVHVRVFTEAAPPAWSWIVLAVIVLLSIGVSGWRRRRRKKRRPATIQ